MYWWKVLEISEDSDLKTIKKAYSKLLKINNPEDNPKEYQKLREAYDEAIKYVKKNNKNRENQEGINNNLDINIRNELEVNEDKPDIYENYINEKKQSISNLYNNEKYFNIKAEKFNSSNQIMQFLNRLNDIYNDLYLRSDPEVWEEWLNLDVIWDVEAFPIIEEEIFNFLTTHKYLPAEIWTKLNNNFTWSQNEIKLYNKYSDIVVDEFLKNLKSPNKLKYDYVKSINPEIADEYLSDRQQADEALKNKDYLNAYGHLKKANSLFNGDAELLRLYGDYEYNFDHLKTALQYYKSAFEINNNDLSSALHIGIILAAYESFSEAIPYLSLYLSYNNNDKLALTHSAYCYYYNDDLVMAKEHFQKLLSFEENNKIIKKYLKNIEAQLMGKNIRKITFDKDILMKDDKAEKEINNEKNSKNKKQINGVGGSFLKYILRVTIAVAVFSVLRFVPVVRSSSNYNNVQNNTIYENVNKDNANKENINKKEETKSLEKTILDPKKNSNVTMGLNNVKATEYYKITEPFENRSIFTDIELDKKGLRNKVESQLYIGATKNTVVIFADSKCNDRTINKDGGYRISGKMSAIDEEIGNKIMKEYKSDYQGFDWIYNGYIDASKAEKK